MYGATRDQVDTLTKTVDDYIQREKNLLYQVATRDEKIREREDKITEMDADYRILKESSDVKVSALTQQIKYQEVMSHLHIMYVLLCSLLMNLVGFLVYPIHQCNFRICCISNYNKWKTTTQRLKKSIKI